MKKPDFFAISEYDNSDKEITIVSDNLLIQVDYGDVDHDAVEKDVERMVRILNKYWRQ